MFSDSSMAQNLQNLGNMKDTIISKIPVKGGKKPQ